MTIRTLLKTITTEDNADTIFDPIRIQFLFGCITAGGAMWTYIGLAIWRVIVHGAAFDYVQFGTGFAAMLAGLGTYITGTGIAIFMHSRST